MLKVSCVMGGQDVSVPKDASPDELQRFVAEFIDRLKSEDGNLFVSCFPGGIDVEIDSYNGDMLTIEVETIDVWLISRHTAKQVLRKLQRGGSISDVKTMCNENGIPASALRTDNAQGSSEGVLRCWLRKFTSRPTRL